MIIEEECNNTLHYLIIYSRRPLRVGKGLETMSYLFLGMIP